MTRLPKNIKMKLHGLTPVLCRRQLRQSEISSPPSAERNPPRRRINGRGVFLISVCLLLFASAIAISNLTKNKSLLEVGKLKAESSLGGSAETVHFYDNFERDSLGETWQVEKTGNPGSGSATIKTSPDGGLNRALEVKKLGEDAVRAYRIFPSALTDVLIRLRFYDTMQTSLADTGTLVNIRSSGEDRGGSSIAISATKDKYYLRIFSFDDQGVKVIPEGNPCVSVAIPELSITGRSLGWHDFEFIVTPTGSYAKLDGAVLTNPITPSSDWSYLYVNKLDICKNPTLTSVKSINLTLTWGEPATEGKFYFDDIKVLAPGSDPRSTIDKVVVWYLDEYATSGSPNYLGDKYEKILSQGEANPGILSSGNEGIALFRDLIIRSYECNKTSDSGKCNETVRRVALVLNYESPSGFKPYTLQNWEKLAKWRSLPLISESLVLVYELLGERLPEGLRGEIQSRIKISSDLLLDLKPGDCNGFSGTGWPQMTDSTDYCRGNTTAEENAWFSTFFSAAYNHLKKYSPSYLNLAQLEKQATCFAYHSLTTEEDPASKACLDVRTTTVYRSFVYPPTSDYANSKRYFLVNHNMIHPNYIASTILSLAKGALYYHLINKEASPKEFQHNVANLWNEFWQGDDGKICGNSNRCSTATPECCGFIDKETLLFKRNIERFQGGVLFTGPANLFFLGKTAGILGAPSEVEFMKSRYLFLYGQPAVSPRQENSENWNGAFVNNATAANNYVMASLFGNTPWVEPNSNTVLSLKNGWNKIAWEEDYGSIRPSTVPSGCVLSGKYGGWFGNFLKDWRLNIDWPAQTGDLYVRCTTDAAWVF